MGTSTGNGGIASAIPLITKGRAEAEGSNVDMNYFLGIDAATGRLVGDFEEGADGSSPGLNHPFSGTTTVTSNVWHHAAATYDGTSWQLYLDGALDGTLAVGQPPRADSIQHAALGTAMTCTGAAAGFFQGASTRRASGTWRARGAQIQADRDHTLVGGTGLIARYGLNEGTGTTTASSVAGAPSGTLTGGVTWTAGPPLTPGVTNTAPVVDSVTITPASPTTNQTLTANVTSHDAEGDTLTTSYQWRRAGLDIVGATGSTLNLATAGNGDRGDQIDVRVTVNDGSANSAPVTSAAVTVVNSAPAMTTNLVDRTDNFGATANLDSDATDADGDTLTFSATGSAHGRLDRPRHGRHQRHARHRRRLLGHGDRERRQPDRHRHVHLDGLAARQHAAGRRHRDDHAGLADDEPDADGQRHKP